MLGYKQCGERAVRVDILERLADLIRPALAWRENSPGEKPAGAFDGRGFVVTQAMTSLTGSAGEDFASILRALGYRMDRRPPLPPKPRRWKCDETVSAETPPVEASAETPVEMPPREVAAELPVSGDPAPSAAAVAGGHADRGDAGRRAGLAEPAPEAAGDAGGCARHRGCRTCEEAQPAEASRGRSSAETPERRQPSMPEAPAEAVAIEATPADAARPKATACRRNGCGCIDGRARNPGRARTGRSLASRRPSEERRPRHERNRHRHHDRPAAGAQAGAPPAGEAVEGGEAKPREHHRRRRAATRISESPREGAPAEAAAAAPRRGRARARRQGRPPRERFEGKGRDRDERRANKFGGDRNKGDRKGGRDNGGRDSARDKGGRDKRDRESGPSHRQYATSAAPRERDRPIDPNSPFAKLAALKEQLASRKEVSPARLFGAPASR